MASLLQFSAFGAVVVLQEMPTAEFICTVRYVRIVECAVNVVFSVNVFPSVYVCVYVCMWLCVSQYL